MTVTTVAAPPAVVDADIHNVVPATTALFPYLSDHWREHITNTLFKGPVDSAYPRKAPTSARPGSIPPDKQPSTRAANNRALAQQEHRALGGAVRGAQGVRGRGEGLPGSNLEHLKNQILDPLNVEIGILNCTYEVDSLHN